MALEKKLYKQVENIAYERFGCHVVKQQVGSQFGKIDVLGFRETSGDLEAAGELVAIEVKEEKTDPFLKAIGQTYAYSFYAHRCYLAIKKRYNKKFSDDEIDIATQLGVGLIELKNNNFEVILTSKLFSPQEKYVLNILDKLELFKCTLCRGIYPKKDFVSINKNGTINLQDDPENTGRLKNAIENRKNAIYWLYELNEFKGDPKERNYIYHRRFICKDCLSIFASFISENPK